MVEIESGLREGETIVMMPEKVGFEVKKKGIYEKGKISKPAKEKTREKKVGTRRKKSR